MGSLMSRSSRRQQVGHGEVLTAAIKIGFAEHPPERKYIFVSEYGFSHIAEGNNPGRLCPEAPFLPTRTLPQHGFPKVCRRVYAC